jgi:hypothetical protein
MHFIFGGRHMGMLEYAKSLVPDPIVCDLAQSTPESIAQADIVSNIHLLVREMVLNGQCASTFFKQNLPSWGGKILIGDEVGCGVVPVEPCERQWRDETGRVYQLLTMHASDVTRVWAGIPQAMKRGGSPL